MISQAAIDALRRRRVGLSSLAAALLLTGVARAASDPPPPRARLGVERSVAAADCPSADGLATMVNELSRTTSVVVAEEGPGIVVTLDRDGAGYHARIDAVAPVAGVRVISDPGPSCAALARALAVTLALLVDSTSSDTRVEPIPGAPSEPARRAARRTGSRHRAPPTSGTPPTHRAPPRHRAPPLVGPEAGALGAAGITFDAAPGAWVGAFVQSDGAKAHVDVLWVPAEQRTVEGVPLRLEIWAGRAKGCYFLWPERRAWPRGAGCLDVLMGQLSAAAHRVGDSSPAKTFWLGAGGGLDLTGPIFGRLAWRAGATVLAPLVDERFAVRGVGRIHSPPPVAGLGEAGVMMSIW